MSKEVYILGGYQTDFARNWSKERKHFVAMMRESVAGALREAKVAPEAVDHLHTHHAREVGQVGARVTGTERIRHACSLVQSKGAFRLIVCVSGRS